MIEWFFTGWVIAILPGHYPTTLLAEFLKGSARNDADLPRNTFLDKRISSDNGDKPTYILYEERHPESPCHRRPLAFVEVLKNILGATFNCVLSPAGDRVALVSQYYPPSGRRNKDKLGKLLGWVKLIRFTNFCALEGRLISQRNVTHPFAA